MRREEKSKFVTQVFINWSFLKYSQQIGTFSITWELGRNEDSVSGGLGWSLRFCNSNRFSYTHL